MVARTHERPQGLKDAAYAKARIIRVMMRQAARKGVSARAQAILAHLLGESWKDQRGEWVVKMSQQHLAYRLGCSKDTAKRAILELRDAELVEARRGKGRKTSVFRLLWWLCPELPYRVSDDKIVRTHGTERVRTRTGDATASGSLTVTQEEVDSLT